MRKLYAAFVNIDVERLFVYRMSEKPIKQEFSDGTIETENYLLAADGHYTKFCGTCGLPLDTPIVHSSNIMVYYSLEEENAIRFLKERETTWNLLSTCFSNAYRKVKSYFLESKMSILRNNI